MHGEVIIPSKTKIGIRAPHLGQTFAQPIPHQRPRQQGVGDLSKSSRLEHDGGQKNCSRWGIIRQSSNLHLSQQLVQLHRKCTVSSIQAYSQLGTPLLRYALQPGHRYLFFFFDTIRRGCDLAKSRPRTGSRAETPSSVRVRSDNEANGEWACPSRRSDRRCLARSEAP